MNVLSVVPLRVIPPPSAVILVGLAVSPSIILISSTLTAVELIVVVVPLTVKLPVTVRLKAAVIFPLLAIVRAVAIVLALVPVDPTGAVWNIIDPDPPVPVPLPDVIVRLAPVIFVPVPDAPFIVLPVGDAVPLPVPMIAFPPTCNAS